MIPCISSFLKQRVQCVSVQRSISCSLPVISGGSLGSIISPLLLIEDIDNVFCSSSILKFADGTKIYNIFNPRVSNVSTPLNDDLPKVLRVLRWCDEQCRRLNTGKCSCVHFDHNPCLPVVVEEKLSEKDLGVWISDDLMPSLPGSMSALKGQRMFNLNRLCLNTLMRLQFFVCIKLFLHCA